MKTLKSTLLALSILFLVPMTSQSQEPAGDIMNLTEFTIKYGHGGNFTEGIKKWKKCYKDNNGTSKWNVWHRVQGKGDIYVVTGRMANWAEMEKQDPAGMACRAVGLEYITPHIESTEFNVTRYMPDISRKNAFDDMGLVWVTNFIVNDDLTFNEIVKDVTATVKTKEGDNRGYWYGVMGGEGRDYFVSTPYKDFAGLDVDQENVWKVYENVHGKAKTKETRTKFRATYDDVWSYIYTLEKELSME